MTPIDPGAQRAEAKCLEHDQTPFFRVSTEASPGTHAALLGVSHGWRTSPTGQPT